MSHFSTIKSKLTDKQALLQALRKRGWQPQEHEEPVHLYGYRGDRRRQTAHIVVPRKQISSASNDLGFLWNESEFEIIISDYDRRVLGQDFLAQLTAQYTIATIENNFGTQIKVTESQRLGDGSIRLVLEDQVNISM